MLALCFLFLRKCYNINNKWRFYYEKTTIVFLKCLIGLVFLVTSRSILVSADEVYSELPIDAVSIYKEIDKVFEMDENGISSVNLEEAYRENLSKEAITVSHDINDLSDSLKQDGKKAVFRKVFFGVYGNVCGKGNNGWLVKPIDDLDST